MGYYINPPSMSKEEFLQHHGTSLSDPASFNFESDTLPVCLIDNGWMTAAAVCYDARERDVFLHDRTNRSKMWFTVSRELLKPYYNPKQ